MCHGQKTLDSEDDFAQAFKTSVTKKQVLFSTYFPCLDNHIQLTTCIGYMLLSIISCMPTRKTMQLFVLSEFVNHYLRSSHKLLLERPRVPTKKTLGDKSFQAAASNLLNTLVYHQKFRESHDVFVQKGICVTRASICLVLALQYSFGSWLFYLLDI